jgi:DNA-binding NtrC family response regulator
VEDNPVIQQALHEILLLLDYRVLLADDGEQALLLLEQHVRDISLVISDLVMPRLGGAGLHSKLRRRYPDITMVVMTGYPLEMQSRELLEYGDLFWVQKPFSVETIAETVSRALNASSAPHESI